MVQFPSQAMGPASSNSISTMLDYMRQRRQIQPFWSEFHCKLPVVHKRIQFHPGPNIFNDKLAARKTESAYTARPLLTKLMLKNFVPHLNRIGNPDPVYVDVVVNNVIVPEDSMMLVLHNKKEGYKIGQTKHFPGIKNYALKTGPTTTTNH